MTDEQITELVDNLDFGLRCFVHIKKGTIVTIPDDADDQELWVDSIKEIEDNLDSYVEIEKMSSGESFRIMTDFAETLNDGRLRDKLDHALSSPKPFRNFKFEIDNAGPYREKWFDFRRGQMIDWVWPIHKR